MLIAGGPLGTGMELYFDALFKKINRVKCCAAGWHMTACVTSIFLSSLSSWSWEKVSSFFRVFSRILIRRHVPTFHQQQSSWGKRLKKNV
jgi:hypothetical protein